MVVCYGVGGGMGGRWRVLGGVDMFRVGGWVSGASLFDFTYPVLSFRGWCALLGSCPLPGGVDKI